MKIVQHKTTFLNRIQSRLSYAQVFEKYCGVCFVEVSMMNILEDVMSSSLLAVNFRGTYMCLIRARKIMIKRRGIVTTFVKLLMDAPTAKTSGITYLYD